MKAAGFSIRRSMAPPAAASATGASSAAMSTGSRGALRVPLPPPAATLAVRRHGLSVVSPAFWQQLPPLSRGAHSQPASYSGEGDALAATYAPTSLISSVDWSKELSNTITLIGNLGGDPVLRALPSGSSVCELNLAVKVPLPRGNPMGEAVTDWHKVVMFGDLALEVGQSLRKGQQVAIHGKLRLDNWTDRETGKPRKAHKVIADQIALVVDNQGLSRGGPGPSQPPPPQQWGEDGQPPRSEGWNADDQTVGAFDAPPPSPAPAPTQYPPAQKGAAGIDLQWEAYFQNPGAFFDNRLSKLNPKSPDFKAKDRSVDMAMWLNRAPQWVLDRLQEAPQPQAGAPYGGGAQEYTDLF